MANQIDIPEINKVFVVIRSIGERTESLCHELVLSQGIPQENISTINKRPFSEALRYGFELGIQTSRPWTLCLDADVLLRPGSIKKLIDYAEQLDGSLLEIRGLVLDKFFGGPRQAGNHLYRTSLLPKAIEMIPKNDIRPEQSTLDTMKAAGHSFSRVNLLLGLHDFEQYYKDVFRKCFVQAHKHQEYAEIFVTYWTQLMAADPDFLVALEGYKAGLGYSGEVQIDDRQRVFSEQFEILDFPEKTAIKSEELSRNHIENLINNWQQPIVYQKYFQYDMVSGNDRFPKLEKLKVFIRKKRELGVIRLPFYLFGWGLEKIGKYIKDLFDQS